MLDERSSTIAMPELVHWKSRLTLDEGETDNGVEEGEEDEDEVVVVCRLSALSTAE